MKTSFTALLVLHGAIHLLGFAKAFGLADISQLTGHMSRPLGALWLIAALTFFLAAWLFSQKSADWSIAALPAVMLSQTLIMTCWADAKFGTIANLIVVVPMVLSLISAAREAGSGARNSGADAQLLRAE